MNNIIISNIRKAGIIVCLFFISVAHAQDLSFTEADKILYSKTLNLELDEVLGSFKNPSRVEEKYIVSLAQTLQLLIQEDQRNFNYYERLFTNRKSLSKHASAAEKFLEAEVHLQWAFIYLKFGHEFDAALNLRKAYQLAENCQKKNPKFLPIHKTMGLLNIMIGAVPEKYNWVLNLLGLEGSTDKGLKDLHLLANASSPLSQEADILYALAQGFILQNPKEGFKHIQKLSASHPNRVLSFFGASLAIKDSQSEQALTFLDDYKNNESVTALPYSQYLLGEVYLHKSTYDKAIEHYQTFLKHYQGSNYVKDAYYKIGLCHLLNGDESKCKEFFKLAQGKGKDVTEADVYASRVIDEKDLPNIKLSKVRYATDGGYYQEALQFLNDITPSDLPSKKDLVEYYYRKARVAHKQDQIPSAKLFYHQVIDMSGSEPWYFGANAALQLGYIAEDLKDYKEAKLYFKKALGYQHHEYKNSIDSKARSALNQIKDK